MGGGLGVGPLHSESPLGVDPRGWTPGAAEQVILNSIYYIVYNKINITSSLGPCRPLLEFTL